MPLDDGDLYRLAALRADFIDKKRDRHGEFLSRQGELRTLKGVPRKLCCKALLGALRRRLKRISTLRLFGFRVEGLYDYVHYTLTHMDSN